MASKQNVISLYPARDQRPKHIYDKLEDARERRAKALENREAANSSAPVPAEVRTVVRQMTEGASPDSVDAKKPAESDAMPYARTDLAAPREKRLPKGLMVVTLMAALGLIGLLLLPREEAEAVAVAPSVNAQATGIVPGAPEETEASLTAPAVTEDFAGLSPRGSDAAPMRVSSDMAIPAVEAMPVAVPELPRTAVLTAPPSLGAVADDGHPAVELPDVATFLDRSFAARLISPDRDAPPLVSPASEGLPARPTLRPEVVAATAVAEPVPMLQNEEAPASAVFAGKEVFLHAPDALPADRIAALQSEVEALGVPAVEVRLTGFRISTANVRYFHAADAEAAAAVAEAIGADLRDFTAFRPSPRDGLIELWMDGAPKARAPSQPVTSQRVVSTTRTTTTRSAATTRPRDGDGTSLLGTVLRDVATTIESGAKKTVEVVSGGVSSGVDKVTSGIGKAKGKGRDKTR